MFLASCVKTPIDHSVFHYLHIRILYERGPSVWRVRPFNLHKTFDLPLPPHHRAKCSVLSYAKVTLMEVLAFLLRATAKPGL